MNWSKRILFKIVVPCCCIILLGGCHYENGRWYLGESDFVTLPDFRGEMDKVHDCLVANEDITAAKFKNRFDGEYKKVHSEENWRYWGNLVCLAFNEHATPKQIGKTIVFLTDQIEPGNHAHNDLEAMSLLLKKKLDYCNETELLRDQINSEKKSNMMQKVESEMELLAQKKIIKDLEDQVRKLKEIENLLENKSKQ